MDRVGRGNPAWVGQPSDRDESQVHAIACEAFLKFANCCSSEELKQLLWMVFDVTPNPKTFQTYYDFLRAQGSWPHAKDIEEAAARRDWSRVKQLFRIQPSGPIIEDAANP